MPKGKILMGKGPKKPGPVKPSPRGMVNPGRKKNETVTVYSKLAPLSKQPGKTKPVMPRRGGK